MAKELPALSEAVFSQVQKVAQLGKVQKALQIAKRDVQRAMDEQVELCEIPAPTFMYWASLISLKPVQSKS